MIEILTTDYVALLLRNRIIWYKTVSSCVSRTF